jgi:hypothetical protein
MPVTLRPETSPQALWPPLDRIWPPLDRIWAQLDRTLRWVIAVFGALTLLALLVAPHFILPEEDAIILFQFSRNLAHTGIISYFPHGPHAEGATDFAWMLLVAGGIKLHLQPFWTVALVNAASLLTLPWLLARIAGQRLRPAAALFIIGAFGLMPQATAAALGFSVLPFCCLLTLMVLFFLRKDDLALALTCLALCLFRPDGVVFALPILASALILYRRRARRAAIFAAAYLLPGTAYFLWRWHYFGSFLPLPFLVKSDTARFAHILVLSSVQHGALLCLFAFALAWLALRGHARIPAPTRAVLLCLLLLPNLFYFTMRLDQNCGHRFFIYLPAGAAMLIAIEWRRLRPRRHLLLRAGTALWLVLVCPIWVNSLVFGWTNQFDNRKAIAIDLATLPNGTMLVTEAGFVPYYVNWVTYDAWGLNTERFARRLIQPSDVAAMHPDAMLVYAGGNLECTRGQGWQTPYTTRNWHHMIRNIVAGIDPRAYDLWYAPFANLRQRASRGIKTWQDDQECWFVRRDSPLRPGIEAVLARHNALPATQYLALLHPGDAPIASPPPHARSRLNALLHYPHLAWQALTES